ncbi:MFS transporter [Streptomyces sp. VRA16 Mangrove soil]|uniref:MFS transporter n=1 Tax=Streptomyces sp. VRA16 Mangrove soil TaxID=2817434 RepID=UPI001A9DE8B2|nr:MFS transporter [Streptomyces sp. VRA16 Mangrove soil]MBO1336562.1 MFS transporter [Streptomyces sp. VRA16 Mangrove soil]
MQEKTRGAVVAALMLSMALAALDSTIVSTAVPQIVGDLGGFSVFSWLFSGYLLAVTVTLPVYGKLSDTWGRKPVLIAGSVLFLVGSLLCAGAWNMGALIAFRVIQGLGGGAIQGTVQTLAADLYPLEQRPKIQAKLSTVWATSSVLGPALGGLLASYAGWRWIFLINLPIGVIALFLVVRHLHEPARGRGPRPRIDWAGALAVFAAGGVLLTWLVQGGVAWAWGSATSIAVLCTGVALIGAVFLIERRAERKASEATSSEGRWRETGGPILPGWVWRRRTIAAVNLGLGAMGLLMVAPTTFLPTYAQSVLGLSPTAAGFVLSVMTLSWPIAAALSQHVYRRIGFRDTALIGMTAALALLIAFPLLPFPGAVWQPTLLSLLLGAALGLFQLPLIIGVQSSVTWAERGTATASILFYRQIGQTVGAAVFGAVANGVISGRLGAGTDLDSVTRHTAAEPVRRAIDAAVDSVYIGAACAAAVALAVLVALAPRRFPVLEAASAPPQPAPVPENQPQAD